LASQTPSREHGGSISAGCKLHLATIEDLLVLKLAAAEEPRRRLASRRRDLLDIVNLAEEHPQAASAIPGLKERVARLAANILTSDRIPHNQGLARSSAAVSPNYFAQVAATDSRNVTLSPSPFSLLSK